LDAAARFLGVETFWWSAASDGHMKGANPARLRRITLLGFGLLLVFMLVSCGGEGSGGGASSKKARAPSKPGAIVIAWNPSHQDDTGSDGWHEYSVCGDIVKRTMALLPGFSNVLCWETGMGLKSGGTAALTSECDQANDAHAQVFVSVHVNGGGTSGVSGAYETGDTVSGDYAKAVLNEVAASMGLRYLYTRARSDLLVLHPAYNKAHIRILLELGDNSADRALLSTKVGRQRLAAALAKAIKLNLPSALAWQRTGLGTMVPV
jgi:N-acetylmuramoyl-L-alanine amidase